MLFIGTQFSNLYTSVDTLVLIKESLRLAHRCVFITAVPIIKLFAWGIVVVSNRIVIIL